MDKSNLGCGLFSVILAIVAIVIGYNSIQDKRDIAENGEVHSVGIGHNIAVEFDEPGFSGKIHFDCGTPSEREFLSIDGEILAASYVPQWDKQYSGLRHIYGLDGCIVDLYPTETIRYTWKDSLEGKILYSIMAVLVAVVLLWFAKWIITPPKQDD